MERDDEHLCILCRNVIHGLEEYISHRKFNCQASRVEKNDPSFYLQCDSFEPEVSSVTHKHSAQVFSSTAEILTSEAQFMESLGLSSIQLSKIPDLLSPRSDPSHSKSVFTFADDRNHEREVWEDVFSEKTRRDPITSPMVGSEVNKTDFIKQLELTNVDSNQYQPTTSRWRLWHPEHEVSSEDLWNDVFSTTEDFDFDAVTSDSTLIEMPSSLTTHQSPSTSWLPLGTEPSLPDELEEVAEKPFFCTPCSRSLSNEEAYNKHLMSELHFKRSSTSTSPVPKKQSTRIRVMTEKARRALDVTHKSELTQAIRQRKVCKGSLETTRLVCKACKSQVNSDRIGKHLISHYHHHKSKGHAENKQMALDYIEDIVREAPYNCKICHFYCNWSNEFILHWNMKHHQEEDRKHTKDPHLEVYICSCCRFQSSASDEMLDHLKGDAHSEITEAINRSVQISIRKCRLHQCPYCPQLFLLKFSLRNHVRGKHGSPWYTLPDHELLSCDFCNTYKTCSLRTLKMHVFLAHPDKKKSKSFECRFCFKRFSTKAEIQQHRHTREHRIKVSVAKTGPYHINCEYCPHIVAGLENLKDHMWLKHQDYVSQCGMCGMGFALPQELSSHVKSKCQEKNGGRKLQNTQLQICFEYGCEFESTSRVKMLFHQSLKHQEVQDLVDTFRCIVCQMDFKSRSKLSEHVRVHLKDEMFKCDRCYKLFPSETTFKRHQSRSHKEVNHEPEPELKCDTCGESMESKSQLIEHMRSHPNLVFKCTQCRFVTNTKPNLKSHLLTHKATVMLKCNLCEEFKCKRQSELKRHLKAKHQESQSGVLRCEQCDYTTPSNQHLKRHQNNIHKSQTRFYCKDCHYSCTEMDNLRKHILFTRKHRGVKLYNCSMDDCSFGTNDSLSFRFHLSTYHSDAFINVQQAKKFIENYFLVEPKLTECAKNRQQKREKS